MVFPAFRVIATRLLWNELSGNILAGVALIETLTLTLSVTFGEWFIPRYSDIQEGYGMIATFSALAVFSAVFGVMHMLNLKKEM